MSAAPPPELPGYDFVRELGQGGFADVFLYRQRRPTREVAVKVLRQATRTDADQQQFENEANRMAQLSSHPGIVTIYEVGVSPDQRPYLTMEFCPNDHLGTIARRQPLSVARSLEVGIKVAGAIGSAHRAGILHRDIKPANILVTEYQEPALTDFGIAAVREGDHIGDSQGVSVPFAAPEVLRGVAAGDERSDVYSLGATVYALLAGRSPFAGPKGGEADLLHRILHGPLPPTGRSDVPESLERVLAHALEREPLQRLESAAAFGRALQRVEVELGLAQTALRITEDAPRPVPRSVDDDDSTRLRLLQRVDPDGAAPAPIARIPDAAVSDVTSHTVRPGAASGSARGMLPTPAPPEVERTVPGARRASDVDVEVQAVEAVAPRRVRIPVVVAAMVAIVAVVGVVLLNAGADGPEAEATATTVPDPDAFDAPTELVSLPSPPGDVVVVPGEGDVVASWSPVDQRPGDRYRVVITSGSVPSVDGFVDVDEPEVRLEGVEGLICVQVRTLRRGDASAASREACSDDG